MPPPGGGPEAGKPSPAPAGHVRWPHIDDDDDPESPPGMSFSSAVLTAPTADDRRIGFGSVNVGLCSMSRCWADNKVVPLSVRLAGRESLLPNPLDDEGKEVSAARKESAADPGVTADLSTCVTPFSPAAWTANGGASLMSGLPKGAIAPLGDGNDDGTASFAIKAAQAAIHWTLEAQGEGDSVAPSDLTRG